MPKGYLFFHCNLEFSSIPVGDRNLVIERCYTQLLNLVEHFNIPLGIELTGITLEHIASLKPAWLSRFKRLLDQEKCELIGSGYAQVIGPLVPAQVNSWNQKLGLEVYERLLQRTPRLALVNEMAFSSGLLDIYLAAGYQGIIVDRRNLPYPETPVAIATASGSSAPLLWVDSILFQRFQRYVHGELCAEQYIEHLAMIARKYPGPVPIYSSDGEIFDYRPARFHTEAHLHLGEWQRITSILRILQDKQGYGWISPSTAFAELQNSSFGSKHEGGKVPQITSAKMPIPCKKQAKYQISRWATSGRNDLWLNTFCHRLYQAIIQSNTFSEDKEVWRQLCSFWGSDYRTHIDEQRWQDLIGSMPRFASLLHVDNPSMQDRTVERIETSKGLTLGSALESSALQEYLSVNQEKTLLTLKTADTIIILNLKRGLAIEMLGFKSQKFAPIIGTIPQGFFDDIAYGADFYSGSTVIELPKQRCKITDLVAISPVIDQDDATITISANLPTAIGPMEKVIAVSRGDELISISTKFLQAMRPFGSTRVNTLTLLPDSWSDPISVTYTNGGLAKETHRLEEEIRHDQAINSIVSNTTGIGATDGLIVIKNDHLGIELQWDPSLCAVLPMLCHLRAYPSHLTRVLFSLSELDETSREGGELPEFRLMIRPTV